MDKLALSEMEADSLNPGSTTCHVVFINYYFCQYALLTEFWS